MPTAVASKTDCFYIDKNVYHMLSCTNPKMKSLMTNSMVAQEYNGS